MRVETFEASSKGNEKIPYHRKNCKHRDRLFCIAITWNTGMRISEVAKLNWLDVRNDFLIVRDGKGGKTRNVFFGKKTNRLFRACRSFCRSHGKNTVEGPVFWGRQGRLYPTQIHRRAKHWFKYHLFQVVLPFILCDMGMLKGC